MSSPTGSSSGSSSYSSSSSSSARRGSAPASAFLAPRFWSQPQFDMPPPRRTSFGTSLAGGNGRLAALSALSMQPRSPGPAPVLAKPPAREATSSAPPTPVQQTQPVVQQQQKQQPQQQPQQQRKQNICFLPGPDGLCVESRRRRGSDA